MQEYNFSNSVEIILCKLTYKYVIEIGFDFYWQVTDKKTQTKHLYPLFRDQNIYEVLINNGSTLISVNSAYLLKNLQEDNFIYILHLPEKINHALKERSL
jgi:regulator of sigma D